MREIKFRAWDKEEQCWLDPKHFYITGSGEPYTCQQGRHNISCRYELMGTERYIIERFTGLKDKKGKEFYENSLVRLQSQYETDEPIDCKVRIVFREGAFRLDFHNMLLNANIAASIGNWSTEVIEEQDNGS